MSTVATYYPAMHRDYAWKPDALFARWNVSFTKRFFHKGAHRAGRSLVDVLLGR